MRLLDDNPSISTREIASQVGISNGSAYYCVTALVDKGFVKLKNLRDPKQRPITSTNLRRVAFAPRRHLLCSFLERKKHEYEDLKIEIERLEIELGHRMNRKISQTMPGI